MSTTPRDTLTTIALDLGATTREAKVLVDYAIWSASDLGGYPGDYLERFVNAPGASDRRVALDAEFWARVNELGGDTSRHPIRLPALA